MDALNTAWRTLEDTAKADGAARIADHFEKAIS